LTVPGAVAEIVPVKLKLVGAVHLDAATGGVTSATAWNDGAAGTPGEDERTRFAWLLLLCNVTAVATPPIATTTAAATAAITTAAVTAIVAPALRAGDAIDHVVELAARDRAVRAFLALEHADPANLVDPITDDVERLDQTLRAIRLDADGLGDRLDDGIILGGRRRRGAFGLHRLGLAALGRFAGITRTRATFDGGCVVLRRRRWRFAAIAKRRLAHRRRGDCRCR
jgi:hypothetical protein